MREIRLYGSEGGGAGRSPYPYHNALLGHAPAPALRRVRSCGDFQQLKVNFATSEESGGSRNRGRGP